MKAIPNIPVMILKVLLHTSVSCGSLTICPGGESGYYLSFRDKPTKAQGGEEASWEALLYYGIGGLLVTLLPYLCSFAPY